jgi:hypothetical protein
MSNKKITLFVMTMMLLIIGLSAVSAIDNQTIDSSNDFDNSVKENNINSAIYTDESDIAKSDNIEEGITNKDIQIEDKNIKTDKTIVINNQTFSTYFKDEYLTDEVSPGDTLDFQGSFLGEEFSMIIDKPVNIITSTNDAYVCVNTTSGDLSGAAAVTSFTIINGGSYTNVSGIYFYNTQIFIKNANHVTINNISAIVEDRPVGSGVGQTAIRENSSYITVENSTISTKNNGGSTSMALSWANNCIIRNNRIIGIGNVGNLFYFNTFNLDTTPTNETGQTDFSIVNVNNTVENNIMIGPDTAASICYGIAISGSNNIIRNNTINYTGMGINNMQGLPDYYTNITIIDNTFNGCNINTPCGSSLINNTVTGYVRLCKEDVVLENNNIKQLQVTINNVQVTNQTVDEVLLQNSIKNITIENCTINNNITVKGSSRNNAPANITINNNQINGNVYLNGTNTLTLSNNNITNQVILGSRNYNQNVNITNNNITTDNEYAIIVNTTISRLNISDNYLLTNNTSGNDAIFLKSNSSDHIINNEAIEPPINIEIKNIIIDDILIVNKTSNITITVTNDNDEEVNGTITITDGQVTVTSDEKTLTYTPTTSGDKELTVTFTNGKESASTSINITVEPIELVVDDINARVNQTINITARITAVNETLTEINKGKVVFKVNGKTLKDENGKVIYAKVVNGIATIENYTVPQSWNKAAITIEAVYSGSVQQNALRSQKQNMTITQAEPTITTEDITAKIADTITLKATVNDNGNQLNSSKVVFKINGKSVKDADGKVIYVELTDNVASIEYTLPSTYKAKSYTITAVLITAEYNRFEDNKTLTITK